jgi:outer membrane protein assembly factor BamE (lipoprotein component of BamABCDE complex)
MIHFVKRWMNKISIGSIVGLWLIPLITGCAIKVGGTFDTSHIDRIKPGTTTQSDVQELFGPPPSVGLKNGKPLWTYLNVRVSPLGGAGKGTVLSIEFDEKGVVETYSYIPYHCCPNGVFRPNLDSNDFPS